MGDAGGASGNVVAGYSRVGIGTEDLSSDYHGLVGATVAVCVFTVELDAVVEVTVDVGLEQDVARGVAGGERGVTVVEAVGVDEDPAGVCDGRVGIVYSDVIKPHVENVSGVDAGDRGLVGRG